ncbi:Prolyl 4-hydroxylase subunit alpha-2 [Gossypium arboreum]|uniref:Prolyl 4-hydroxylase subunit alpha-2 n=1 Tax=Gossypium arboreum TaxID=29729 RepID=A0A0B0NB39_GOSAR|nr:Prolyl 4-hydroxylase subunit alpha-2 [Gossypium arboreum]
MHRLQDVLVQCKTMSGTWHQLDGQASVRPCLGHGIDLMDELV